MTNERPNVTVVYQDAQQTQMGCFEFIVSILVGVVMVLVFFGVALW